MVSTDFIKIDGVSSNDFGLYIDTPPIVPLAKQRVYSWKTGIDSDSSAPDNVFEDIKIPVSGFVFMRENFDLSEIYAKIANGNRLELSRFAGKYLKIKQIGEITPQQSYDGAKIKIPLNFVCNPFKYRLDNEQTEPVAGIVTNPGTRFARPIYNFKHGTATTFLRVNGQDFVIDAICPKADIVVDAERMIIYNAGTGENLTKYTSGFIPYLNSGANTVKVIENGVDVAVKVVGNWRDY